MAWRVRPDGLVLPESASPTTPSAGSQVLHPNSNDDWGVKNSAAEDLLFGRSSYADALGVVNAQAPVWQLPRGTFLNPSADVGKLRLWPTPDVAKVAALISSGVNFYSNVPGGVTNTSAVSGSSPSEREYGLISTTTTLGNAAVICTSLTVPSEDFMEFGAWIRTPATITTTRVFVGLFGTATFANADTPMTSPYIGFRYSAGTDATHWVPISHNGTTASVGTAMTPVYAVSTSYLLKWRRSGTTIFFSINNGTEQSQGAMNLPSIASVVGLTVAVALVTTAASARTLNLARAWAVYP